MENAKQKAIELAYGEYWDELKKYVNDDGWFDKNSFYNNIFSFGLYENIDLLFLHKDDFMRPKYLAGIENNNNWISINSEDDLPKDSYNYWIMQSDGLIQTMKEFEENKKYWKITATHYQSIIKPNYPIY